MHPEDVQKLIGLLDDQSVRDKLCSVLGIAPPFTLESVFREAEPAVGANALRLPSVHRPDRASRLSRALAEMHEAHRRVKKANRTQAQTISKLQADLKAVEANRDAAIENARVQRDWQASYDGLNWFDSSLTSAVAGAKYARVQVTIPVDIERLQAAVQDA